MTTPTKSPSATRRVLTTLVKLGLVFGLLYVLAQRGFLSLKETANAYDHPLLTLGGQAIIVGCAVLSAIRWWVLLRATGVELTLWRTLRLSLIGNFFNIALPGAVSGDFVKAFYIAKDVDERRARVFGTIFFDRILGISALALVCAAARLSGVTFEAPPGVGEALAVFIYALGGGVLAFYTYLLLVPDDKDLALRIAVALEARVKAVGALKEFYLGMRQFRSHPGALLAAMGLSAAIHISVGLACAFFAWAMGDNALTVTQVYATAPLGFLVTAVPVSPAGVGTGHAAFLFLFKMVGSARGADVFTLFALAQFFTGGIGGLVYLRFKGKEPAPTLPAQAG